MAKRVSDSQIFDAIVAVVAKDGLNAATTRRIAEAARVNEVTLFRRFGSKAEMLKALLRREVDAFVGRGLEPSGDVERDLTMVVETYASLIRRIGAIMPGLFEAAMRDPGLVTVLEEPRRMMMAIAQMVAHYQAAGELIEEPPLSTVAALLGPVFVMGFVGRALPGVIPVIDAPTVVKGFLRGRSKRSDA